MEYYPIFIDLKQQPCLVVGGGGVALRKIRLLSKAGAMITVVAPQLCTDLSNEFADQIEHHARPFLDADIDQKYRLITAASDDQSVNARVSELAQAANIPVNVVDQPELCSFITPAIVDRSPVVIAVSSGGAAPVLARYLRSQIEAWLAPGIGRLGDAMRAMRTEVANKLANEDQRRRYWESILAGEVSRHFAAGRDAQGIQAMHAALESPDQSAQAGDVALVGAGPGDPDLLTFRALRLMQQADVVLYDRLVSPDILELARRDAERIYVGKRRSEHAVPQGKINHLLLELAQQGKRVVRLKGGDPFIFGRGGEEISLLAEAGVSFQIVPGITAASGCATYAGIPLTHRDFAQSCLFVTGHLKNNTVNLDWQYLVAPAQTLVIYMGLLGLPTICEKLIEHGMAADMPIALIEQGTTEHQRVFTGTLSSLPDQVAARDIHAPTLIIVGRVVSLHQSLRWFEPQANSDD